MEKEKLILDGGTIQEINAEMREFLDLDNDQLYGDVQVETKTINKNLNGNNEQRFFWSLIKDEFEKAERGVLSIFFSSLGYRPKDSYERVEIEYQKYGITLNMALMYLKVLASENLIELIDSENMGYYILKK